VANEDALKKSEQDVFARATKKEEESLEKRQQIENYKVFSTERLQRP
jgi:hypothetical protein